MNEEEEFEFRLRLEREKAMAAPNAPQGYSLAQAGKDFMTIPRGIVRGVQDATDTLVKGGSSLIDTVAGTSFRPSVDVAAKAGQDAFARDYGDSLIAGSSRLAGNIGVTLPVGPVLGAGAKVLGASAPIVNAITSAGFTTGTKAAPGAVAFAGNALTRAAGGGAVGGASAGLIDPDTAGTGALIGAALPPSIMALGKAGGGVANMWRSLRGKGDTAGAQALLNALDENPAALIEKLRAAPELVAGSRPTVGQALQTPQANVLEKMVFDVAKPGNPLQQKLRIDQPSARAAALERVAPTGAGGAETARADFGNVLSSRVIPEEQAITKLVGAQYRSVTKAGKSTVNLPVKEMQKAVDKYLGAGAFGENVQPATAVKIARGLSKPIEGDAASLIVDASGVPWKASGTATPRPAEWEEVSRLRSSINDAWRKAKTAGDKQAAAALANQKQAIDAAINTDLSPAARSAWLSANASHAEKMQRFHTGPQRDIFRMGQDGQPLIQSSEIAGKFWHQGGAADKDVQSLRRLVDDNPAMLGQFRSMITTEGLGGEAGKNAPMLGDNFVKWVNQRLPGLREAFDPAEVKMLQNIAADITRNTEAVRMGAARAGSDTAQKAANALSLGALDSEGLRNVISRIPLTRGSGTIPLDWMRGVGKAKRANALANLLADSGTAANAIERLQVAGASKAQANELMRLIGQASTRSLPVAGSQ